MDKELMERRHTGEIKDFQEKLDLIEEAVSRIRVSAVFYDELFILKDHIQMMRRKLVPPLQRRSEEYDGSDQDCP